MRGVRPKLSASATPQPMDGCQSVLDANEGLIPMEPACSMEHAGNRGGGASPAEGAGSNPAVGNFLGGEC